MMLNDRDRPAEAPASSTPFAGQKFHATRAIIQQRDRAVGAPLPPLSPSQLIVPPILDIVQASATADEVATAQAKRRPFLFPGRPTPFMNDVARAARLLKGKRAYIEIGIFDRGNLAYISSILADDAIIIGVDIEASAERDAMIRETIKPGQTVHIVIGDSRVPATVAEVSKKLDGRKADAIFVDGGHDAFTVLHDYVNYSQFVSSSGVVLFHDSLWEGTDLYKGVADALAEIDKLDPVFICAASRPVYRFMRPLWREPIWGVVGIVPMTTRLCARLAD